MKYRLSQVQFSPHIAVLIRRSHVRMKKEVLVKKKEKRKNNRLSNVSLRRNYSSRLIKTDMNSKKVEWDLDTVVLHSACSDELISTEKQSRTNR